MNNNKDIVSRLINASRKIYSTDIAHLQDLFLEAAVRISDLEAKEKQSDALKGVIKKSISNAMPIYKNKELEKVND